MTNANVVQELAGDMMMSKESLMITLPNGRRALCLLSVLEGGDSLLGAVPEMLSERSQEALWSTVIEFALAELAKLNSKRFGANVLNQGTVVS